MCVLLHALLVGVVVGGRVVRGSASPRLRLCSFLRFEASVRKRGGKWQCFGQRERDGSRAAAASSSSSMVVSCVGWRRAHVARRVPGAPRGWASRALATSVYRSGGSFLSFSGRSPQGSPARVVPGDILHVTRTGIYYTSLIERRSYSFAFSGADAVTTRPRAARAIPGRVRASCDTVPRGGARMQAESKSYLGS